MKSTARTEQQPEPPRQFAPTVTWKLMAAFAVLAVLPLGAGLIGFGSNRAIDAPLERVDSLTAAIGVHDRAYRTGARSITTLFSQPRRLESLEALEETAPLVQQALDGMQRNIDVLISNPYVTGGEKLLSEHREFVKNLRATLQTSELRLRTLDAAEEKIALLMTSVQEIEDTTVLATVSGQNSPNANIRRLLDELRYTVATLGILGREALTVRDVDGLAARRREFAANLQAALQDLSKVPATEMRRTVSTSVETIYDISIANGGFFDQLGEVLALHEQELAEQFSVRMDGLRAVNVLADIDQRADVETHNALLAVHRAVKRSDLTLMAVGGFSTLLALLVMIVYLRGNVLRRLFNLTSVTKELTSGKLETPVRIEGRDELSELAYALESFRHSALRLRKSEIVLEKRTEELEFLNKELDQFAYVASHDLKAPMRAISSLAGFLREDIGDKLDEQSAKHLDMLQGRIDRLDGLLDSLLEYSRAGRLRSPPESVELRELVMNCVDIVGPQGEQIEMTGSFGRVHTWKTPLEQVVRNLLDNAFKHNDPDNGLVAIDGEVIKNEIRLVIADNGPGIDPKYHERIFGMFQTLQPRDQVEGSGMGLAILRKLVDTHGGTIRVESEPAMARGTRFYLTWPVTAVIDISAQDQLDPIALASLAQAS